MKRKNKTALGFLGAAFLAGLGLFLFLPRVPALILRDEGGRIRARIPCESGLFTHRFVHSVHLSAVDEEYRIGPDGDLRLTASRFDTLGVGIPYDADLGFALEGRRFVLSMDRTYASLPIRVSPLAGHVILTGGREYALTDWFAPGDLFVLSACKRSRTPVFLADSIRAGVRHFFGGWAHEQRK